MTDLVLVDGWICRMQRHFLDILLHPRRQTFYGYTPSPEETDICGYTPSPKETDILWIYPFTQGDGHLWIHPFAMTRPIIYIMLCISLQSLLCFSVSVFCYCGQLEPCYITWFNFVICIHVQIWFSFCEVLNVCMCLYLGTNVCWC